MKFDQRSYRDELSDKLRNTPRELRKQILESEQLRDEYWIAKGLHQISSKEYRLKKAIPDLDLNLDDFDDLCSKMQKLAPFIYRFFDSSKEKYDPYKGHMKCGDITDKFIEYFTTQNIIARRIERTYEIKGPDGNYNDSFGHVYLIVDGIDHKILIDPTWLQWVDKDNRESQDTVLVLQFSDNEDLKRKILKTLIGKNPTVLAFYLGFDEPEILEHFKDTRYEVLSEERARIND